MVSCKHEAFPTYTAFLATRLLHVEVNLQFGTLQASASGRGLGTGVVALVRAS
jgi:predicted transcriptional regulator